MVPNSLQIHVLFTLILFDICVCMFMFVSIYFCIFSWGIFYKTFTIIIIIIVRLLLSSLVLTYALFLRL